MNITTLTKGHLKYIVLILICVLVFLYVQTRMLESDEHQSILESMSEFKNIDSRLERDVLLVRSGKLLHYNTLDKGLSESNTILSILNKTFLQKKFIDNIEISRPLFLLKENMIDREQAINSLKSKNGVLRNSLIYFSFGGEEITNISRDIPTLSTNDQNILYGVTARDLPQLTQGLIRFLRDPDESMVARIESKMSDLDAACQLIENNEVKQKISILIRHLKIVLDYSLIVDKKLAVISKTRLSSLLDKLQDIQ